MNTEAPIDISESFDFFGLERGVKLKTVKEAFRRYVKVFHPDLFPRDSDEQKMAAEKLIAANSHFEKLKTYFEEVKTAGPEASAPKPKEEPKNQDDWQDWETQRQEEWDTELRDWMAATQKVERDRSRGRKTRDKRWLVYFVRAFVSISLLVMWNGYFAENKMVEAKTAERAQRLAEAQATGNSVAVQWYLHTVDVEDHGFTGADGGANWDKRVQEQPGKIIPMLFWTVAGLAALFSKRAIDFANKLLEKPGTTIMFTKKEAV